MKDDGMSKEEVVEALVPCSKTKAALDPTRRAVQQWQKSMLKKAALGPIGLLLFPAPELLLIAAFGVVGPLVRVPLGSTHSTSKVQSF